MNGIREVGKMISKKTKQILASVLLCFTLIGIGSYTVAKLTETKPRTIYQSYTEDNKIETKVDVLQEVLEEFKELTELEIAELQMSKTYNLGKGNSGWTEVNQKIQVLLRCHYNVDLSSLNENTIIINGDTITIFLTEPTINKSIEDMNFGQVIKGKWYGLKEDIKLQGEELYLIQQSMLDDFQKDCEEYMNEAKEKGSQTIKSLLGKFNLKVRVVYVGGDN